jgi:DNA end-binding protein Ku
VHAKDGGRVRMKRYCEREEKEVPYAEIAKGYESPDGRTVTLTDEDLADLPLPSKKIIDVLAFVDAGEIDPLMFSKAYYVGVADQAAAKPYALLRDALVDSGQIAVTKIALRTRESPAVLRVHDGTLVLQTCIWPDEVRPAAGIAPEGNVTVRPQELKMARSLMDTLSEDFDLAQLHDDYQQALQQVITARLEGVELPHEEEPGPAPDNVIDLMEALRSSLKQAKGGRAPPDLRARRSVPPTVPSSIGGDPDGPAHLQGSRNRPRRPAEPEPRAPGVALAAQPQPHRRDLHGRALDRPGHGRRPDELGADARPDGLLLVPDVHRPGRRRRALGDARPGQAPDGGLLTRPVERRPGGLSRSTPW